MTLFDGMDGSFSAQEVIGQHKIDNDYYQLLRKAIEEQDNIIGWTKMLKGKMAKSWEHAQDK